MQTYLAYQSFIALVLSPRLRSQLPSTMISFRFNGQQLDNDLVTSASSLLNAVNVPNLLWGNYLLTVYGVPTIVDVSILSRNDMFSNFH